MNYLTLHKEISDLIEKKLDEIHTFEEVKEDAVMRDFKKDEFEIPCKALENLETEEIKTDWYDYFGDSYDTKQCILADYIYHSIIESRKFREAVKVAVDNFWYDEANR